MNKIKNYLTEILKLRASFPEKENSLIARAYRFAKEKHKGQKFDGQDYPYFIHPAYAGLLLARWGRGYEEICAGILHDVVEDCGVSLATIRRMFGSRIAFLVDGMSWERRWDKEEKKYKKDREGFYKKIMSYSEQDCALVIVHAADEMSKLGDILGKKVEKKDEEIDKTRKRYLWIGKIMIPFYREVGLKKVSENVWDKVKEVLGEMPESELDNYASKKSLEKIKEELSKVRGIDGLR